MVYCPVRRFCVSSAFVTLVQRHSEFYSGNLCIGLGECLNTSNDWLLGNYLGESVVFIGGTRFEKLSPKLKLLVIRKVTAHFRLSSPPITAVSNSVRAPGEPTAWRVIPASTNLLIRSKWRLSRGVQNRELVLVYVTIKPKYFKVNTEHWDTKDGDHGGDDRVCPNWMIIGE